MSELTPNLNAEPIPGVSAAGFELGEAASDVIERIGDCVWFENDRELRSKLIKNQEWVGVVSTVGRSAGNCSKEISFSYGNDVVALFFGGRGLLYRIMVGQSYEAAFSGVKPGANLNSLQPEYALIYNDEDDDFLISVSGSIVEGISFITDYRASLDHAPVQTIQYISIHDWSLR